MKGVKRFLFLPTETNFKPALQVLGLKLLLAELLAIKARDREGDEDRDRPSLFPSLPP